MSGHNLISSQHLANTNLADPVNAYQLIPRRFSRDDFYLSRRHAEQLGDETLALFVGASIDRRGRQSDFDGTSVLAHYLGSGCAWLDSHPERDAKRVLFDFHCASPSDLPERKL